MFNLKIDPEFRDLIPPLTEDELKKLEEGIVTDGCRDPLTVWNHTIVDGHNRYSICQKHDIEFQVKYMNFESREEAIEWILHNQLGRRNLSDLDRTGIALKYKEVIEKRMKERMKLSEGRGKKRDDQLNIPFSEPTTTRKELAKMAGVSEGTLQRAKIILEEGTEEQIERARKGGRGNGLGTIADEIRGKTPKKKTPESVYQEPDFGEDAKAENPTTKTCSCCGRELPLDAFRVVDGYRMNKCRVCADIKKSDQGKYSLADAYEIARQMSSDDGKVVETTFDDALDDFRVNAEMHVNAMWKIVYGYTDLVNATELNKQKMLAAIDEAIENMGKIKEIIK